MGVNIQYGGTISIDPPLNIAELDFLREEYGDHEWGVDYILDDELEWAWENERCYETEDTLRYIIDAYLKPGASKEGDAEFSGFTFNHVLNGQLHGECDQDGHSEWLVIVEDNVVEEHAGHTVFLPPQPCTINAQTLVDAALEIVKTVHLEGDCVAHVWPNECPGNDLCEHFTYYGNDEEIDAFIGAIQSLREAAIFKATYSPSAGAGA